MRLADHSSTQKSGGLQIHVVRPKKSSQAGFTGGVPTAQYAEDCGTAALRTTERARGHLAAGGRPSIRWARGDGDLNLGWIAVWIRVALGHGPVGV